MAVLTNLTNPILETMDAIEYHNLRPAKPSDEEILRETREICNGLALSERARVARYDKIVEVLKNERSN